MDAQEGNAKRLLWLLRRANGGAVSANLIAKVLWPEGAPDDVDASIRMLTNKVRRRFGVVIRRRVEGNYLAYEIAKHQPEQAASPTLDGQLADVVDPGFPLACESSAREEAPFEDGRIEISQTMRDR